jgi:hypothetical protein
VVPPDTMFAVHDISSPSLQHSARIQNVGRSPRQDSVQFK